MHFPLLFGHIEFFFQPVVVFLLFCFDFLFGIDAFVYQVFSIDVTGVGVFAYGFV